MSAPLKNIPLVTHTGHKLTPQEASFIDAFREKLRNGLFQCVYIVYFIVDRNNYRKLVFACLVHISANNFGTKYKYTRNPAFVKIKNRFSIPIELF